MVRGLLLLALQVSFVFVSISQVQQGNLLVHNPSPFYKLSPDGKTLGIHEAAENGAKWRIVLDLATWSWKPTGSIWLQNVFLTPDFKSAFSTQVTPEGFKGDKDWLVYDKYLSWFFPSNLAYEKIQWADRNFIIAATSDGKFLTAGQLKFMKKEKHLMYPKTKIMDLDIYDPIAGKVVRNVLKGEVMELYQVWWHEQKPTLIDNDKLLVWGDRYWTSLRLSDGVITPIQTPEYLQEISGKYGMGIAYKDGTNGVLTYRKFVANMETGKIVYDSIEKFKEKLGYLCAAGPPNSFYTFTAHDSELRKEEIIDDNLVVTKRIKLDISDLASYKGEWGSVDHSVFKLIVSEQSGIVMMLPLSHRQTDVFSNTILVWKLDDGKLICKNPNFIQPHGSFLAREQASRDEVARRVNAKPEDLPLNVLLRTRAGFHILQTYEKEHLQWKAVKFVKNEDGNYSPSQVTVYVGDFMNLWPEVASTTVCPQCNGRGNTTSVEQKTTEKVDKMIYTQITTTTTKDVSTTNVCSHCHGVGFSY